MKKLNANAKPCVYSTHESTADEWASEYDKEEPVKSEESTLNANYNKNKEEEWRNVAKKERYAKSTECKVIEKRRNDQYEVLQHDNDHYDREEEVMHYNKDYGNIIVMPLIVHYQEAKRVESSK